MKNNLIVFDVDGVLGDFILHFTRLALEMVPGFHEVFSNGESFEWGFLKARGFDDSEVWNRIHSTRFWETMPLLATEGDRLAMWNLTYKADLLYLTSRSGQFPLAQTQKWLAVNGFPPGFVEISSSKAEDCAKWQESGTRVVGVIEDHPVTIGDLQEAGFYSVARDWMYNREAPCSARVSSVAEFCRLMEEAMK